MSQVPAFIGTLCILTDGVRRQINWDNWRAELTKYLAHLVFMLSGGFVMLQAPLGDGLSFDPSTFE